MEIPVTAKSREYIPEWRGNHGDQRPIRATLRYLNTEQRSTLMPWRVDAKGVARMEPDTKQIIVIGIERIEDCVVVEDGVRKEIRTGRDLLASYGLEGLATELFTELMGMNAVQEVEKNS